MVAQLNRLMSLLVLCGLLTQPAMAAPDGHQTLVVNGDTLVVQMAEPLPAGYQTIVVGDDTLMVQVLAEPRPANEPPAAVSGDSLSEKTKAVKRYYIRPGGPPTFEEEKEKFFRQLRERGKPKTSVIIKTPVDSLEVKDGKADIRIGKKLAYGALSGLGVGAVGGAMGFALGYEDCSNCGDDPGGCDFCGMGTLLGSLFIGSIGYSIGTAVGVSRVDPYDSYIMSLGGSVVGFIGGLGLTSASSGMLWPFLLVCPVVGATLASEWSRSLNPSNKKLPLLMNLVPDPRGRVSVGLVPDPKGGLSVVAALRF